MYILCHSHFPPRLKWIGLTFELLNARQKLGGKMPKTRITNWFPTFMIASSLSILNDKATYAITLLHVESTRIETFTFFNVHYVLACFQVIRCRTHSKGAPLTHNLWKQNLIMRNNCIYWAMKMTRIFIFIFI